MPLGKALPPIRLEANYTEPISLKDAVNYAIANNLAIRISYANKEQQKWNLGGSLAGFLPNVILNGQDQYLQGSTLIGGIIPSTFQTPNVSAQAGIQWFGFQGGSVLFGSLSSLHNYRAAKAQVTGTINDTLLAVSRGYYNLVNTKRFCRFKRKRLMFLKRKSCSTSNWKVPARERSSRFCNQKRSLLETSKICSFKK